MFYFRQYFWKARSILPNIVEGVRFVCVKDTSGTCRPIFYVTIHFRIAQLSNGLPF